MLVINDGCPSYGPYLLAACFDAWCSAVVLFFFLPGAWHHWWWIHQSSIFIKILAVLLLLFACLFACVCVCVCVCERERERERERESVCLLLLLMLCFFYGKVDIVISCNEMNKVLNICIYFPWLCSVHQVHFGLTSWSSWNRWKEREPQKKKKRTESKWPLIWYWFCKLSASVTCFSSCAFSKVLHFFLQFSLTWQCVPLTAQIKYLKLLDLHAGHRRNCFSFLSVVYTLLILFFILLCLSVSSQF